MTTAASILFQKIFFCLRQKFVFNKIKNGLKQFTSSKSAKYRILIKSINFTSYFYTNRAHVFCVKPKHELFTRYICITEAVIKDLVIHFHDLQHLRQALYEHSFGEVVAFE